MKTKDSIKATALELFNAKGIKNVTLRDVATVLNKSYGNITYHFAAKEHLLEELFEDYNSSLSQLQTSDGASKNLLEYILKAPEFSFDITIKYLFFFVDFTEIKRSYPEFITKVELKNQQRKQKWKELMLLLKQQHFLRDELSPDDIDYIMELSIGMRMYYFQEKIGKTMDKVEFSKITNQLLYPYLSDMGKEVFLSFEK